MLWVKDQRLNKRCIELLFSQAVSAFISSAIAGVVLIYTFWDVADRLVFLFWVFAYVAVAIYRTRLHTKYLAVPEEEKGANHWFIKLALSLFTTGLVWGLFLLYLVHLAEGPSAAVLMANYAFLLAGAVTAYAVSFPMFLLFSVPILLPSVGYLFFTDFAGNSTLVAMSLGWYLFMVSAARRFGLFAMRSLGFEYKNRDLVEELEEHNRRAEVLAEELKVISNTDALTGLYNRRSFDESFPVELARAYRQKTPLSLILCDVDYFKAYNDTWGHPKGDECLRRVARVLSEAVRQGGDRAARYGGEEFAVVLTGTDIHQAKIFAERLRRSFAEAAIAHPSSGVAKHITLSMGVSSLAPEGEDGVEDLIYRADKALYKAKECGRDQVQLETISN